MRTRAASPWALSASPRAALASSSFVFPTTARFVSSKRSPRGGFFADHAEPRRRFFADDAGPRGLGLTSSKAYSGPVVNHSLSDDTSFAVLGNATLRGSAGAASASAAAAEGAPASTKARTSPSVAGAWRRSLSQDGTDFAVVTSTCWLSTKSSTSASPRSAALQTASSAQSSTADAASLWPPSPRSLKALVRLSTRTKPSARSRAHETSNTSHNRAATWPGNRCRKRVMRKRGA
mmetsp:Transcript_31566/g.107040  ORF Transcript_31566/g.107040 Transcript_31566/m.107040 type:complete len:235 (-) Transcript_31566:859-1563(-)